MQVTFLREKQTYNEMEEIWRLLGQLVVESFGRIRCLHPKSALLCIAKV